MNRRLEGNAHALKLQMLSWLERCSVAIVFLMGHKSLLLPRVVAQMEAVKKRYGMQPLFWRC